MFILEKHNINIYIKNKKNKLKPFFLIAIHQHCKI